MAKLLTPNFRVSFPQVFEPKSIGDGKPKYSVTMLFNVDEINKDPQQKELWENLRNAVKAAATEKWGTKVPKNLRSPFRDGSEKEDYDGYGEGIIFMNTSTTTRPGLVDESTQPIIAQEDFYPGCYARATVNPYAWSFTGNNGVSFGLQNIQKTGSGEPFGGRSKAEDDFTAIETDTSNADALFSKEG